MRDVLLRLDDAAFGHDGRPVVHDVTVDVSRGELAVLAGPRGTGKSTLLRGVVGLSPLLSGRMEVCERVGYVAQGNELDPLVPATLAELVQSAAERAGDRLGAAERRTAARGALAEVGLTERASMLCRQLSRGQLRRALLARALASNPDLLVLDEPFAGVDESSRRTLFDTLSRLRTERHMGVLLVGQALEGLTQRADTILQLDDGTVTPTTIQRS